MDESAIEASVINSNKSAVENLRKEKYDHAIFFLNQALLATKGMKEGNSKGNLLAMTYNNLGCYLKRLNKLSQALEYFSKSSELSKKHEINIANVTCSHLNISKIYSEQGNHELALRHGLKSLFLLRHNFANKSTLVSSLIIAYQTVGIEYKFLNQTADSVECFQTGLGLSLKHLGRNHEVTLALKKSLQEAGVSSGRSQSHQSKKRDHSRGQSAGVQKMPSRVLEEKKFDKKSKDVDLNSFTKQKEKILRRIGRNEIRAAVKIQRWWRRVCRRLRYKKIVAAKKIQNWWKMMKKRRKSKLGPRSVKRCVIKKNRIKNLIEPAGKTTENKAEKKVQDSKQKKNLVEPVKPLRAFDDVQEKRTKTPNRQSSHKSFNSGKQHPVTPNARANVKGKKEKILTESSNLDQEFSQKSSNSRRNYLNDRRADITHQINSLIKIQSLAKMAPVRLRYLRFKKAAIRIQSFFRGFRVKRLFQMIRNAVIFIQYMYRKLKSRMLNKYN